MPANVETMFSVRETPWHHLGIVLNEAPTSIDALRLAGLDWLVEKQPTFLGNGTEIPDSFANVRSTDQRVLGVVGPRYQIVQNHEAFAFMDDVLKGGDTNYETAGSLKNGESVWILAKMPGFEIAGDEYENYLFVANSHNGRGSLVAGVSPVRIVCQNTLNLAIAGAKRSWRMIHTSSIGGRAKEASTALSLTNKYTQRLITFGDFMAGRKVSIQQLDKMLEKVFPAAGDSKKALTMQARNVDEFRYRYFSAPDLDNVRGTAWGVIQAMSDFTFHRERKESVNKQDAGMMAVINGEPILDKTVAILEEMVA